MWHDTVILDIEGTVCSISFVRNVLFPYFLKKLPLLLGHLNFPLHRGDNTEMSQILEKFPKRYTTNRECLMTYIKGLVDGDIKDPILKELQGFVWQSGYDEGEIVVNLYDDVVPALDRWTKENKSIYVYSSGSIKAQRLFFSHVNYQQEVRDLTNYIEGFYDPTIVGSKIESKSYLNILTDINKTAESVIFLSDNINEVQASMQTGIKSLVVRRPGNASFYDADIFDSVDCFDKV